MVAEQGESSGGVGGPPPPLSSGFRGCPSEFPVPLLCWVTLGFGANSRCHSKPAQPPWWARFPGDDLASQHVEKNHFLLLQETGWEVEAGLGRWGGEMGVLQKLTTILRGSQGQELTLSLPPHTPTVLPFLIWRSRGSKRVRAVPVPRDNQAVPRGKGK